MEPAALPLQLPVISPTFMGQPRITITVIDRMSGVQVRALEHEASKRHSVDNVNIAPPSKRAALSKDAEVLLLDQAPSSVSRVAIRIGFQALEDSPLFKDRALNNLPCRLEATLKLFNDYAFLLSVEKRLESYDETFLVNLLKRATQAFSDCVKEDEVIVDPNEIVITKILQIVNVPVSSLKVAHAKMELMATSAIKAYSPVPLSLALIASQPFFKTLGSSQKRLVESFYNKIVQQINLLSRNPTAENTANILYLLSLLTESTVRFTGLYVPTLCKLEGIEKGQTVRLLQKMEDAVTKTSSGTTTITLLLIAFGNLKNLDVDEGRQLAILLTKFYQNPPKTHASTLLFLEALMFFMTVYPNYLSRCDESTKKMVHTQFYRLCFDHLIECNTPETSRLVLRILRTFILIEERNGVLTSVKEEMTKFLLPHVLLEKLNQAFFSSESFPEDQFSRDEYFLYLKLLNLVLPHFPSENDAFLAAFLKKAKEIDHERAHQEAINALEKLLQEMSSFFTRTEKS